jgi:hypothetical protein
MRSRIRLNEGDAMPVSETDLDLTATDVSEESREMLVAEMASDYPDVMYIVQNPSPPWAAAAHAKFAAGPPAVSDGGDPLRELPEPMRRKITELAGYLGY